MKIFNWEEVFVHNRTILAFKRVEGFSERMSSKLYFWDVNAVVLSAHAPSGEKSDD